MQVIHFIINPNAGSGKEILLADSLSKYFENEPYEIVLKYTQYKKHAIELTEQSILAGAKIIVACGGDGTVHEVASCMVNTTIALGIIPLGSGNGLANNLKIPYTIAQAIALIKNKNGIKIDVGRVNDNYFFSNMGIGFDATVIGYYEKMKSRGLKSYLKATMKSFQQYRYQEYSYILKGVQKSVIPFLFFISNSNEMGNKVSITPKASLQDGLLDVVIVPRYNKLKILLLGMLVLFKKHFLLKSVQFEQVSSLTLQNSNDDGFALQIDGEYVRIEAKKLEVSILKGALTVLAIN